MITRNGKLDIFERFEVDRQLPKFKRKQRRADSSRSNFADSEEGEEESSISFSQFQVVSRDNAIMVTEQPVPLVRPWWRRVLDLLWAKPTMVGPLEPIPTMTIEEFFAGVRNTAEEIHVVETRLAGFKKALQDAERNGQVALREQLAKDIAAVRAETQLVAMGQRRFVTEETLVEFVKKCPKGLRLDFIRNFMRVIPDEVAAKKARCDELGLFDNYAVLHYDPEGKAWAETEEEIARRKDPILFGLMLGRRRLYFVADWVDEHCDLTLEQIADLLGEGAISEVPEKYEVPA